MGRFDDEEPPPSGISSDPKHLRKSLEEKARQEEASRRQAQDADNTTRLLMDIQHWSSKLHARTSRDISELRDDVRHLIEVMEENTRATRDQSEEIALLRQQCGFLRPPDLPSTEIPLQPIPATRGAAPAARVIWWESETTKLGLKVVLALIGLLLAGIAAWTGLGVGSGLDTVLPP